MQAKSLAGWREVTLFLDNYTCQRCGSTEKENLEAHHIKSRRLYPELELEIGNGETLCLGCHRGRSAVTRYKEVNKQTGLTEHMAAAFKCDRCGHTWYLDQEGDTRKPENPEEIPW